MNLSLITSFIIGTILLLSLLKVNMSLVESSMDSMSDQIAKVNTSTIAAIVEHDFRKIGYGYNGNSLVEATPSKISFQGDLDDDGTPQLITWEFDQSQEVVETSNPDDYILIRTIDGDSKQIKLGVTKFELVYYDNVNQSTTTLDDIRRIEVRLLCESPDPIGDKYMKAAWEKDFIPLNIE